MKTDKYCVKNDKGEYLTKFGISGTMNFIDNKEFAYTYEKELAQEIADKKLFGFNCSIELL